MAVIMGVDPSQTCTGIAAMDTSHYAAQPAATDYLLTSIKPKDLKGLERLAFIKKEFNRLALQLQPDLVVFEGYAKGALWYREEMGEVQGILRLSCFENGVPIIVATPQQLKTYATSKGAGDKAIVRACVERRWGVIGDKLNDDEIDAFVLMMIGMGWKGFPAQTTDYQKKVLDSIEKNPQALPGVATAAKKAANKVKLTLKGGG